MMSKDDAVNDAEEHLDMSGDDQSQSQSQSAQRTATGDEAEVTAAATAEASAEPATTANSDGAQPAELAGRLAALEAQLAQEREAATDYMQRWQRAQADFSNFRRRAQQDMELRDRQVAAEALAPVLLALDSFERAFQTLPDSLRMLSWLEGIALIDLQLRRALELAGIEAIPVQPGQAFDPAVHHAVGQVESHEHPEGSIAAVVQRGYRHQASAMVIRPALVQIAIAASSPAPAEAPPTGSDEADPPADETGSGV